VWDTATERDCQKPDNPLMETLTMSKLAELINEALATLTPREQQVLRMRYGLDDGHPKTLREVGRVLPRMPWAKARGEGGEEGTGVTPERVRQIEAKALRKMRHPSCSGKLREYIRPNQQEDAAQFGRLLDAIFGERADVDHA